MSLHTCQELEREAGTGGGDRGWWGQNLEKGEGPREGHKLGRRPRPPGKGMREGALGLGRDEECWPVGYGFLKKDTGFLQCLEKAASPVSPAPFIEEAVFAPLYILASFVKNKVPIGVWVYFWAFYLVPFVYISVFVPALS